MVNQLVSPNLHVVLLHAPLGLLFVGLAIELFSFLGWRRSAFRVAGRWMILVGTLAAVPAAMSGMYALRDVTGRGIEGASQLPWRDVLQESKLVKADAGEAWEHMIRHTWAMSLATAALLLVVLVWLSASDAVRAKLHFLLLLITLGAIGAMGWGAWHGGEGVYRHAVGVEPESAEHENETKVAATSPASAPTIDGQRIARNIEYYLPPIQMHVIFAGCVVSLSIVALGLAIRNATTRPATMDDMDDLAAALSPQPLDDPFLPAEQRARLADTAIMPALRPHYLPASRFWLLAGLMGVLTAVFGIWVLARAADYNVLDYRGIWEQIRNPDQLNGVSNGGSGTGVETSLKLTRRMAHVIAGSSIIVLTLLLAIFTRIAPRKRMFVMFLGLLLLATIAAQVWLGTLLLFDTNSGSMRAFN
ncbi:MAG: hypothetical protein H7Z14_18080 [Anaerolineae bacterium]|nr:hypothetical protein [Phycisphaerae bacterium]